MISSDYIDLLTKMIQGGGVLVRVKNEWRIDATREFVPRTFVGVLMRARYLTGKRRSGHASVTTLGRRTAAVGKPPPIGVEVTYRLPMRHGRGRVIQSTGNRALVIPAARYQEPGKPVCLHDISRPTSSSPWKGTETWVGRYRKDAVLWPRIEACVGLLPESWGKPYVAPERTLARLVEVLKRLTSIGAHYDGITLEERAAIAGSSYARSYEGHALAWFRNRVDEYRDSKDSDVADYLEDVLKTEGRIFDAAEVAYLERDVHSAMSLWDTGRRARNKRAGIAEDYTTITHAPLSAVMTEMRADPNSRRGKLIAAAHASVIAQIDARWAVVTAKRAGYAETRRVTADWLASG
jgi:hypothetical protein